MDNEAEILRLDVHSEQNTEILEAMQLMKEVRVQDVILPCYYVPFGADEQFYGREDIIRKLEQALNPVEDDHQIRSFVLHGMGGVGKTKIALNYVQSARANFDAIFWISADNPIKLTQSFIAVSSQIGLTPADDDAQDTILAVSKIRQWLVETGK